jgi:hypothetical protein
MLGACPQTLGRENGGDVSGEIDPGYFEINTEFGNFVYVYPTTITFGSQPH